MVKNAKLIYEDYHRTHASIQTFIFDILVNKKSEIWTIREPQI